MCAQKEEGVKRLKEDTAAVRAPSALHDSVVHELRRLGAQTNGGATATSSSSSSSTTPATEATTSTSSSASASGQLSPSFIELNSFAFPSDVLFESEAWDLCEVELRNWWAPSTRGGRPAVEIGSAKRRSSDTYVYLALPTDTANPAHPGTPRPSSLRSLTFVCLLLLTPTTPLPSVVHQAEGWS